MSLQNRVLPTAEIVADPARGMFMGNRGILHADVQQTGLPRLGAARWRHSHWICCVTSFRGRRRSVMTPGQYTELFFLDEAVALAAGHRPCAECRRADYLAWRAAWTRAFGTTPAAAEMDRLLHAARIVPRTRVQQRAEREIETLPDGAFVLRQTTAHLVLGDRLLLYAPSGYAAALPRPATGRVTVLTPAPTLAVLAAGYRPLLHATAAAS